MYAFTNAFMCAFMLCITPTEGGGGNKCLTRGYTDRATHLTHFQRAVRHIPDFVVQLILQEEDLPPRHLQPLLQAGNLVALVEDLVGPEGSRSKRKED